MLSSSSNSASFNVIASYGTWMLSTMPDLDTSILWCGQAVCPTERLNLRRERPNVVRATGTSPESATVCPMVLYRWWPVRTHQYVVSLMCYPTVVQSVDTFLKYWIRELETTDLLRSANVTKRSPFSHRLPRRNVRSMWRARWCKVSGCANWNQSCGEHSRLPDPCKHSSLLQLAGCHILVYGRLKFAVDGIYSDGLGMHNKSLNYNDGQLKRSAFETRYSESWWNWFSRAQAVANSTVHCTNIMNSAL